MNNIKIIIPRNEVVFIDIGGNPVYTMPLKKSEKLVEVGRYNDFIKPVYNEKLQEFVESATVEEISILRPAEKVTPISDEQKYKDMVNFLMTQFITDNVPVV